MPPKYPVRYTITGSGEKRLFELGSRITELLDRRLKSPLPLVRELRDLQNEQYMLAKLSTNPPLTKEELIYGGPETAMLSSFNELLRRGWIEQE